MLKAVLLLLFPIYILASDVQEQGDIDKMQLIEKELDNMRKEISTLREELKKKSENSDSSSTNTNNSNSTK